MPQPALIHVDQGVITSIEITQDPPPTALAFSDSYLLPGLIECNVKPAEAWESLSQSTEKAVRGGVTTLAIETKAEALEEALEEAEAAGLFCDTGYIACVQSGAGCAQASEPLAYKTYLSPQAGAIPAAHDLPNIIEYCKGKLLIVDSSMPPARLLHVASPYRSADLSARLSGAPQQVGDFTMAVDLAISDCGSDHDTIESAESDEDSVSPVKSVLTAAKTMRSVAPSADLADHVSSMHLCFKELTQAELEKYSTAGQTYFRSQSNMLRGLPPPVVNKQSSGPARLASLRPPTLNTVRPISNELSYNTYLMNVPATWECRGVEHTLGLLQRESRVLFSNVASAEAVSQLVKAKEEVPGVWMETCPHYLFFSSEAVTSTSLKTFPPIRTEANRKVLLRFLLQGTLDLLSSHHRPVDSRYKVQEFRAAMPGLDSLGHTFTALWTLLKTELHPVNAVNLLLKTTCYKPAELLGLQQTKGGIAVGKHADFFVFAPHQSTEGRGAYAGARLQGRVERVFVRGRLAFDGSKSLPVGQHI